MFRNRGRLGVAGGGPRGNRPLARTRQAAVTARLSMPLAIGGGVGKSPASDRRDHQ